MNYLWIVLLVLLVGYFVWSRRGGSGISQMAANELQERLKTNPRSIVVVDVREPSEFRAGHIAQAKNIPLGGIGSHLAELPKDTDVVFVCRSGSRSMMASRKAAKAGLKAVYNLTGGMSNWRGSVKR